MAVFSDNEIDGEALAVLTEKQLAEMIPKLGPRAKVVAASNALFGRAVVS
jgi:hypothetical protein